MIRVMRGPNAVADSSDRLAVHDALREVQRACAMPVAFLGRTEGRSLRLTEFRGIKTQSMQGLDVAPGDGLGGHAMVTNQVAVVVDYSEDSTITHHYDSQVLAEGLRSMLAYPVIWSGQTFGVLYGALRARRILGDRAKSDVGVISRRLAIEFAVQHEVERRLSMAEAASVNAARPRASLAARDLESLREIYAELRVVAQSTTDGELRARLGEVTARLGGIGTMDHHRTRKSLAPREVDVLALVALGCTNAEIGRRLALSVDTVKTYLRTVMRKLDAQTRHEAVVRARTLGLLP